MALWVTSTTVSPTVRGQRGDGPVAEVGARLAAVLAVLPAGQPVRVLLG